MVKNLTVSAGARGDAGLIPGLGRSYLCFPGGSEVKASAWNAGDPGLVPGLGRSPREGKWQPTPVLLPGESHGARSWVGYSPWGRKELDMTEQLYFHWWRKWQSMLVCLPG